MTDPLVPAEIDLRDFEFMPLQVARLRDSDLAIEATGDEFRAAVLLWCTAWHQVPAGSLPDNDTALASYAGYGRGDVKSWMRVRTGALRGFVRCSDGRLYHPTIAEKAIEAWDGKLRLRHRRECERIKKAAQRAGAAPVYPTFDDWRAHMERTGSDRWDVPAVSQGASPGTAEGQEQGHGRDIPGESLPLKGQGIGDSGEGQETGEESSSPDGEVDTPVGVPPCPHTEIVAVYHEVLPEWRRVVELNETRKSLLRARWRSKPARQDLGWWRRFFGYVRKSPFLMGQEHDEHRRPFEGDLEWLVRPTNFAKVIEGKYHAPEGGEA